MRIQLSSEQGLLLPGDFGAQIKAGELLMPKSIVQLLSVSQIYTAEDFLGFLQVFPASLASNLGWDLCDVQKARKRLLDILKPYVSSEYFEDEPSFSPPYGVR